jgi:nitrate/nitrite transporter NarK
METVGKIILTIISYIALAAIALSLSLLSDCDDIIITVIMFVISALVLALFIALGYAAYYMIWVVA